jgi:hypothetical protein
MHSLTNKPKIGDFGGFEEMKRFLILISIASFLAGCQFDAGQSSTGWVAKERKASIYQGNTASALVLLIL